MVGLLVFVAQPVWAAPLTLGDFTGATVQFLNVVADDGAQIGLATLNGDSLEFSPRLSSGATDGGTQMTVATLTFGLAALPGFAIDSFAVQESGVMSLTGVGSWSLGGKRQHAGDTHLEFSAVHLRCYACVRQLHEHVGGNIEAGHTGGCGERRRSTGS